MICSPDWFARRVCPVDCRSTSALELRGEDAYFHPRKLGHAIVVPNFGSPRSLVEIDRIVWDIGSDIGSAIGRDKMFFALLKLRRQRRGEVKSAEAGGGPPSTAAIGRSGTRGPEASDTIVPPSCQWRIDIVSVY